MSTVKENAAALYTFFERAMDSLQSPLLLVVRLYWGWQFFQAGWGKLGNIQKVIGFFTSLGIPLPALNAYFVSGMECVGGVLLILGLFSRPIAALLAFDMIVAYVTADREALFSFFSDPGKFYDATPYTFLFASLLILVFGPGRVAVDALIASRKQKAS
ncbi:MAG: DoxX family protein [Terriglobales bacterium]|jgi:putative oxidoreductase